VTTTGTTANFTSGNFQNLSGNTITGNTINATSGVFQNLFAASQTFGGNLTFSGDTSTLGNATIASGLTVTGTISGTTITGTTVLATTGLFVSLTGTTTTGVTAQFTTGTFSSLTGTTTSGTTAGFTTGTFTSLTGTTTTGVTAQFTTGTFTSLTGTTTSGTTASFATGTFTSLTGTTTSGTTARFTTGTFTSLTGTTTTGVTATYTTGSFTSLTGVTATGTTASFTSGNFQTVSGVTVIGSTTVSGATVTGTTANFTSGNFGNIISSAATMSGALIMANQQQVQFREAVGNGVNHIALQAPASVSSDKTITLPDQTGTVVTTGDNGSVTSTMILDGTILNADINASAAIDFSKLATGALPSAITVASANIVDGSIVNADINASAAIVDTKLATIATAGKVSNSATTATNANTASAIVARDASGNFSAGTITANLTGTASNVTTNANLTGDVTSVGNATAIAAGAIVNADINASAAIALSKLATGALPAAITVDSVNIVNNTIVNADINASAAIDFSKLATGALPSAITVASANIVDGSIVNADINASAAIADTKLATIATAGKVSNSATTATNANTASAIVARDASGNFSAGTITANLTGTASNVTTNANLTGDVTSVGNATTITAGIIDNANINASAAIALSKLATGALPTAITVASANIVDGTIVNADINASAAIAGTKISPDFGSQTIVTTGVHSAALGAVATPSIAFTGDLNTGIYSPGADQLAVSTGGVERVEFGTTEVVFNDGGTDVDFRVEGDTNANLFKIDAGLDQVQVANLNGGPLAGFRNRIINGNFDFWQRGTSFTGSEYTADRWVNSRVGTTHTASRQGFTLGENSVANEPTYYCRTITSSVAGASNNSILLQKIEDVRTFAGQQVTVSFWARVDSTKNISPELVQDFGSGGSPSAAVVAAGGARKVSIGTSWQKVSFTATLPSISGKTLGTDNNSHLTLNIWFDAGSSFNSRTDSLGQQSGTFDIAQVQIEPGSVATPFEQRPIGTELALCQRYYWQGLPATNLNFPSFVSGSVGSWVVSFPATMRTTPTSSNSTGGMTFGSCGTPTWDSLTKNGGRFLLISTGITNNATAAFGVNDFLAASAEL
jgi:hypothetical protein